MSDSGPQPAEGSGVRRRRRAVGPAGARREQPIDAAVAGEALSGGALSQDSDDAGAEELDSDADARLRREVPPHHGG